jgi:hypothetical protein
MTPRGYRCNDREHDDAGDDANSNACSAAATATATAAIACCRLVREALQREQC